MARAILATGAIGWSVAFLVAVLVAIIGVERLLQLLPPLAIDTEAVRGAVTAVASGLALAALLHLAVVVGLRRGHRRAWSAGILLSGFLCATFVAAAAAAFTSAVAEPSVAPMLAATGAGASIAALAYGLATVRLVGELRSGAPG